MPTMLVVVFRNLRQWYLGTAIFLFFSDYYLFF
jgi:hypothetical protein